MSDMEEVGKAVDKVFEDLGGSTLDENKKSRSVDHIICHPFFIDRTGEVPINSGATRNIVTSIMPKFDMGKVVGSPRFKLSLDPDEAVVCLCRHAIGDWGDMCREDREANDLAMHDDGRLLSSYVSQKGKKFYIITEADRSITTCLMVEEY